MADYLPKIDTPETAKKLTKHGAIATLVFVAMNLLGTALVYFAAKSPEDGKALDAEAVQDHLIGTILLLPPLLFFAYRIYTGKGWLVAGIVLAWFVGEALLKIVGGTTNVGWMFAYAVLTLMLLNGLRGCWWLRKGSHDAAPEDLPLNDGL